MSAGIKAPKRKNADSDPLSHVTSADAGSSGIPLDLQQLLLNLFSQSLQLAENTNLTSIIQQVKMHLFRRDFASAFGQEDYLTAYALRWSPSRALAYTEVFINLDVMHPWVKASAPAHLGSANSQQPKVVCLGGGAGAEIVALAGFLHQTSLPRLSVYAVDIADWSSVLKRLQVAIETTPRISPFASAAVKAANRPLLESGRLQVYFEKQDILKYTEAQLRLLLPGTSLVTLMFTLNELFTNSMSKTTALLLAITDLMQPGSWLLVVDSPGSYSEVSLGKGSESKRYPMHWLLDYTLLKVAGADSVGTNKWRKCSSDESRWFRLAPKLNYPLTLEDMRYQIHVFERQGAHDSSS